MIPEKPHCEFDPGQLIDRLARVGDVLPAMVRCFSGADARWHPDENAWSVLQIICHLVDEEIEDFRTRVMMTLENPTNPWPPIDPEGWATQRDYQGRSIDAEIIRFVDARAESVRLLRVLEDPDWSISKSHPHFGDMIAKDLLCAWCAHDALHLRQLSKRLYQLAHRDAMGGTIRYAGDW